MQYWLLDDLLLMLVIVNGIPVLVGMLAGSHFNLPLDGGLVLRDGNRLLGPSKTLRGLLAAIVAGTLVAPLAGLSHLQGTLFALLSMAGDISVSLLKRRLHYPPSCSSPLLDQLPEALLPLLVLNPVLDAGMVEIIAASAAFTVIDLLLTRILHPAQPACR